MKQFAMLLATLAIGLGLGVGAVAVADDQGTPRAAASQDAAVLRELRNISKRLDLVNKGNYVF